MISQPQPLRAQIQQPLSAELLSQQQLKQAAAVAAAASSPKRGVVVASGAAIGNVANLGGAAGGNIVVGNPSGNMNVPGDTRHLLSQSIIHQSYGVSQANGNYAKATSAEISPT